MQKFRGVDRLTHSRSGLLPRRVSFISLLAAGLLVSGQAVFAINPDRALTQSLQRIWQVQQGLPDATVYCVRQMHDGYLYLGTQTGLARFDGVRFTPVSLGGTGNNSEAIWVRDLFEDGAHDLWIATQNAGLLRWRGGIVNRYGVANGLPSERIRAVCADAEGSIWVCTAAGLARQVGDRFVPVGDAEGLTTSEPESLSLAADGSLWVGGGGDVNIWSGSRFKPRHLSSVPASTTVQSILIDGGTAWLGTTNGLVRLEGDSEKRFTTADGLADNWVLALARSANGNLWIGTKDGFSRCRASNGACEFESYRTSDGLSQSVVYTLCEDREGSLWAGTRHGLNQFLDRRTIPFTASEGLPSNDTGPVVQDGEGNIWVGTLNAGLAHFDGKRFSVVAGNAGLPSESIIALAGEDGNGLWVGTNAGLSEIRDGRITRTFTAAGGLPSNEIHCLYRDSGGMLWIGTSEGAAVLKPDDRGATVLKLKSDAVNVLAIGQRTDGTILISTRGGDVYAAENGSLRKVFTSLRDVDAFHLDADGVLWMGTLGGGLQMIDGSKTVTFSVEDGLFDDDIYAIVSDANDRLWMACSKGLFSVRRSDLRAFATRRIKNFSSNPFSPTDGLRTIQCKAGVQPAACRMNDGRLWFSTIRGVIVIDPASLPFKLPPAPASIEQVIVDGEEREPARLEVLQPGRKNLAFRYTGLSFVSPTRMTFRYKLDGFDRDWVDAGTRREAFYTNLPPGQYRFNVAARNIDGQWNSATDAVGFAIVPYIYQRIWFWPLCAAILATIGGLWYRGHVRRIRERLSLILVERGRIARELHDTLLQGFSGVTMEMQALYARLGSSPQRQTLGEIIKDAGTCMQEARRSVAGLRSGTSDSASRGSELASAIAETARQVTEMKDVRLRLKLPSADASTVKLPADTQYNLVRIIQEAIANAVRHSGARCVDVEMTLSQEDVRVVVRDDGSGFDPDGPQAARPGHYGLIGMRERASQIGAVIRIDSAVGRGTNVEVSLPRSITPAPSPPHVPGGSPVQGAEIFNMADEES